LPAIVLAFYFVSEPTGFEKYILYRKGEHQMNEQARPKAIARRITRPRKARLIPRNLQYRLYNVRSRPKRPYRQRERRG
jgi:hypothetical protein